MTAPGSNCELMEASRPSIEAAIVQQHIEQAARGLEARQADALLVFRRSNILGFCGVPLEPSDRLVCGLISRDGQVAFIVPAFEAGIAANLPPGSELEAWEEHEDPYAATAKAARKLGVDRGRILLDSHTWLSAHQRFSAAMPNVKWAIDSDLIDSIRIVKTPDEVASIRAACIDTGKIYRLASGALRIGMTELELRGEVLSRLEAAGVTPHGELIQGGESASIPHRKTGPRRLRAGDAVIVDFVAARSGYLGDMTRTFAVGTVSDEIKRAYRCVREAQSRAIEAIRPGAMCGSIDAVARSVVQDEGLGDFFVHRLGHGIGMDVHEPPYFVQGSTTPLAPGMCLTVEPGVYVPGEFGIRIEDVIVVTDKGCKVLTKAVPTDMSSAFE